MCIQKMQFACADYEGIMVLHLWNKNQLFRVLKNSV